jgi:hypothetical protein
MATPSPCASSESGVDIHVSARGNEHRGLFRDDQDRRHFLELLESTVGMFGMFCGMSIR